MRIVSNVDLPKTFWISIDPKSPVAHLNGTGYLNGTLEYLRFIENPNFDVTTMSQHFLTVTNDYLVEYNAEVARRRISPLLPSRLSAVFAFGRKKDAVAAARDALGHRVRWAGRYPVPNPRDSERFFKRQWELQGSIFGKSRRVIDGRLQAGMRPLCRSSLRPRKRRI